MQTPQPHKNTLRHTGGRSRARTRGRRPAPPRHGNNRTHGRRHPAPPRNRTFKKTQCSPIVDGRTIGKFSCYTPEYLLQLKKRWNARHPDSPIKTNIPKEIWKFMKIQLRNICDEEKCWIRQDFVDDKTEKEIEQTAFVPEAPEEWKLNPNTWLSSVDITKVMKQYERRFKCFRFIGPSPIDFDSRYMGTKECVWKELCEFSLQRYIDRGVNKLGFIFNLDKHTQPGSHWVSMFVSLKRQFIFYFNSTGEPVPPEIDVLRKRIEDQGKSHGIRFRFYENKKEHQKEDTECGMYSLFFVINMLLDKKSINYFKKSYIPDNKMEEFRRIYFS
jgi:hypothetical protein